MRSVHFDEPRNDLSFDIERHYGQRRDHDPSLGSSGTDWRNTRQPTIARNVDEYVPTRSTDWRTPRPSSEYDLKVSTFDGKQDWRSYYAQFKVIAEYNQWSVRQQAMQLVRSLQGSARSILADMEPTQMSDLTALVTAIERRYQPRERTLAHKALFNNRRQGMREDVSTYGEALRLLALQAFPNIDPLHREGRIIDRFLEGLQNTELRKSLYLRHLDSFDGVLSAAVEWEALDEAIMLGGTWKPRDLERVNTVVEKDVSEHVQNETLSLLKQIMERVSELETRATTNPQRTASQTHASNPDTKIPRLMGDLAQPSGQIRCLYCHKQGHIKRDCFRYLRTITCYSCGGRGHFADQLQDCRDHN